MIVFFTFLELFNPILYIIWHLNTVNGLSFELTDCYVGAV